MNKNKGFIGIGILLAIILGVAVVGGGAYYLGKSSSNKEKQIPENVLTNNQKQEAQRTFDVPTGPFLDESNYVAPAPLKKYSITVLSPNGGETYKVGDKINIKWKSNDLPKNIPIQILLMSSIGSWNSSPSSTFTLSNDNSILNTGSATFTIPDITSNEWSGSKDLRFGNYYKIYISQSLADDIDASDYSDNTFTITSSPVSTVLPQYIGTHSDCRGQSSCWPPIITTSNKSYSCLPSHSQAGDGFTTGERIINGKKYCISSSNSSYAGGTGSTNTYITANGTGTKTTTFGLTYQSCGVWRGDGTTKYSDCQTIQSNFINNLDALIDSLMF